MKITIPQVQYSNISKKLPERTRQDSQTITQPVNSEYASLSGYEIPFGSIKGIKKSKIDFLAEKFKLAGIIQSKIDEVKNYSMRKIIEEELAKFRKQLQNDIKKYVINNYTKNEILYEPERLQREILERELLVWKSALQKANDNAMLLYEKRAAADKNDYELLHKLHTALMNDNTDLYKVYKDYYSDLNNIGSIEKAKERYPKLEFPQSPQERLAKMMANGIDRGTANELLDIFDTEGMDKYTEKLYVVTRDTYKEVAKKNNTDVVEFANQKLFDNLLVEINNRVANAYATDDVSTFSTNPQIPKITNEDLQLLNIDYDKYVLHVLKEMYINGKKLSEIEYNEGRKSIKPKAFSNSPYKFEKPDEIIKNYLKKALKIRESERNYETFNTEMLQARLKHFGNSEIAHDEKILDKLIEFDSSQFTKEDRPHLIRFLRILDDINDKNITIEEGNKLIKSENLSPHGTKQLNKAEKEQKLNELKLAQQKNQEFRTYCSKYDAIVDELYHLKMPEAGSICSTYRPKDIDETREISDKLLKIIEKYQKNGKLESSESLEKEIKYYNEYLDKNLYDGTNPILKDAVKFAKNADGSIDEVKAGHYIACEKITGENYRELYSNYDTKYAEILDTIHSRLKGDNAVKTLIQFDNYLTLPQKEQLKITNILKYFDFCTDTAQKPIVESIVNKIYIPNSTIIQTSLNKEKTIMKDAEMLPSAKMEIIKDKKFPLCLDYFELFERAMTRVAQSKEEDGIQTISSNNKTLRKTIKQEVKISKDERLYSSTGDYKFDMYKPGLHKNKTTKA